MDDELMQEIERLEEENYVDNWKSDIEDKIDKKLKEIFE